MDPHPLFDPPPDSDAVPPWSYLSRPVDDPDSTPIYTQLVEEMTTREAQHRIPEDPLTSRGETS